MEWKGEWIKCDAKNTGWFAAAALEKVKSGDCLRTPQNLGMPMTQPTDHPAPVSHDAAQQPDVVESIVQAAPMIFPIVGGVLLFFVAFIPVFSAGK